MKDSSQPAFPALDFIVPSDISLEGVRRLGSVRGMTLRDYFAAHAPTMPEQWYRDETPQGRLIRSALWCWAYADAMIKNRDD